MPYAKRRVHPELNRAYAHIAVSTWREAVGKIKDNLLDMGFEDEELDSSVKYQQQKLEGLDDDQNEQEQPTAHSLYLHTDTKPDITGLNLGLQGFMEVREASDGGYNIRINEASAADLQELHDQATEMFDNPHDVNELIHAVIQTDAFEQPKAPADSGETFVVPQLCLDFGDGPELAEKRVSCRAAGI